jgi:hypothetical protein
MCIKELKYVLGTHRKSIVQFGTLDCKGQGTIILSGHDVAGGHTDPMY